MGKDKITEEVETRPSEAPKPDPTKLDEVDTAFLATLDGIVTEIGVNISNAHEAVARFNEKFRAKKIPKSKIPAMLNAVTRLASVFGEDDAHVKAMRREINASELATNEVGTVFDMEKRLKKCMDILAHPPGEGCGFIGHISPPLICR